MEAGSHAGRWQTEKNKKRFQRYRFDVSGTIRVIAPTCLVAILSWIACAAADAYQDQGLAINGLLFGDTYHVASHHTEQGDGATGLVLRRGYLTFDADFSKYWEGRLRFELNQSGEFETYTFDSDFKDFYLARKLGRHRLVLGLQPTPTYDLIESIWGLRYLARTPLDLQGVASRDTGIAASGPLNANGTLKYRAMLGTGVQFGSDSSDGSKLMGALTWTPSPDWFVDFYLDFEELEGSADRSTIQVFAGYRTDKLRWGMQYSNQDRQDDPRLELASGFFARSIRDNISLVGRIDRVMEPSPKGDNISYLPFDPTARATFFVGGVEFRVSRYLVITPNTVITAYDRNDEGIRPDTDFHLRMTFFLKFE